MHTITTEFTESEKEYRPILDATHLKWHVPQYKIFLSWKFNQYIYV